MFGCPFFEGVAAVMLKQGEIKANSEPIIPLPRPLQLVLQAYAATQRLFCNNFLRYRNFHLGEKLIKAQDVLKGSKTSHLAGN